MNEGEEREFSYSHLTILYYVAAILVVLLLIGLLFLQAAGPFASNSKLAQRGFTSGTQFWFFLVAISAVVWGLIWFIMSLFPQFRIVCRHDGFTIYSKTFWDSAATIRNFRWIDVDSHSVKSGGRDGKRFVVLIRNEEINLMTRTIFNQSEFDLLELTFDEAVSKLRN